MEPYVVTNLDGSHQYSGMNRLHVGLDIGQRKWVAGILDLRNWRYSTESFSGDDAWQQCVAWLAGLLSSGMAVHVLYEAGRNGFELARELDCLGIEVGIVSTCSVPS